MSRRRYVITASTFDRKGRHIATGVNDYKKSHPAYKEFAVKAGESECKHFIHSEFSAMLQSRGKNVHSIFVQRFDQYGNPKLARPCKTCELMLKIYGVKVVRFTTDEGVDEYTN